MAALSMEAELAQRLETLKLTGGPGCLPSSLSAQFRRQLMQVSYFAY